jgi:hypothetical protein
LCPATCAVRRADATFLPQTGQETQHGAGCSTASGARWQGQSHASPGGGVGTNLVKARSRLGSPRMHQGTPRTDEPEDINVSDHPCRGVFQVVNGDIAPADTQGARALGAGDKLGSIEPGKFADLFIVRGNPLRDIRNTRPVRTVMKSGVLHDPAELFESVEGKIGGTAGQ